MEQFAYRKQNDDFRVAEKLLKFSLTDKVIIGSFTGFQEKSIRITESCSWYAVYMSCS